MKRSSSRLAAALAASAMVITALSAPAAAAVGPTLHVDHILSGYDHPVLVTNAGAADARIFIVEQSGRIRIARYNGSAWVKGGTFLDLRSSVDYDGAERGLLGLAFAPDYARSGKLYVSFTAHASAGHAFGPDVVVEYRRQRGNKADPHSARTVLAIRDPYENHNGGDIAFGADGKLYWGTGDGGSGGDPQNRSQDLGSRLGKILRIDPADPDGSGPRKFSVPSDNPFVGRDGARPEIWAYGLRNPWRWSFDRGTGDLWIGDVGQDAYEEIDHSAATGGAKAGRGANYGWHVCEGRHKYGSSGRCDLTGSVLPVYEMPHSAGDCAVIGGYVYRASETPAWDGSYVFSDNCTGVVSALDPATNAVFATTHTNLGISSFGEDARGHIYVADVSGGTISTLTFQGLPPR